MRFFFLIKYEPTNLSEHPDGYTVLPRGLLKEQYNLQGMNHTLLDAIYDRRVVGD